MMFQLGCVRAHVHACVRGCVCVCVKPVINWLNDSMVMWWYKRAIVGSAPRLAPSHANTPLLEHPVHLVILQLRSNPAHVSINR